VVVAVVLLWFLELLHGRGALLAMDITQVARAVMLLDQGLVVAVVVRLQLLLEVLLS
jgi:hypothetical protein